MAAPAEVVIFFVGLALWSRQLPNDCGLKAILPRVEHATCEGNAHASPASHSPLSMLPIQNHQAAIIFPRYNLLSQEGWEAEELPGQNLTNDSEKLVFVRLDGDSVHFFTHGATNDSPSLTGMKLAHVREQLCPARTTLREEYKPPYYEGAAAVVALPEGAVKACLSVPAEARGRLDTRVDMKTIDTLDILGGTINHKKKLRLQPRSAGEPIQLMIVNVPESLFQETPAASEADGVSHMKVYLAMGEPDTATCALSLQQWWDQLDPDGIPLCNPAPSFGARAALSVPDAMLSVWASGANFECSNTQWP